MSKIIINTKQIISSYKPIEIEIDGTNYVFDKPVTTNFIDKLLSFEKQATDGDIEAAAKQLSMVTGMDIKLARKYDLRVIPKIVEVFLNAYTQQEKKETPTEKKVKESGGKKLPR